MKHVMLLAAISATLFSCSSVASTSGFDRNTGALGGMAENFPAKPAAGTPYYAEVPIGRWKGKCSAMSGNRQYCAGTGDVVIKYPRLTFKVGERDLRRMGNFVALETDCHVDSDAVGTIACSETVGFALPLRDAPRKIRALAEHDGSYTRNMVTPTLVGQMTPYRFYPTGKWTARATHLAGLALSSASGQGEIRIPLSAPWSSMDLLAGAGGVSDMVQTRYCRMSKRFHGLKCRVMASYVR